MIKKLYLPLVALLVLALSSCSKMGELSADYFTTDPEVLEAIGGKVPVTITGTFPEKYFKKNATVEVTPVLRWNGGEAKSQSATFQGEKVSGNNQTISYKTGGTYTMKASFDYVPEMLSSELYLDFVITRGSKEYTIPSVKIADGVIATSELLTVLTANPSPSTDAFQRIIAEAQEAQILFLIQQANVRASELKSEELADFHKKVVEVNGDTKNYKLNNIEISGYASPDGALDLNTGLADKRQANTKTYLDKELKKGKIEATVDTEYTAEDWEGFQKLVEASDIQDKALILRVLSMYSDPEQRETEIKNISSVYKTLADEILPQLRRARLTLNYDIIGRSDEEINEAFDTDASVLSVEELLYAGTLTSDASRKEAIYKKTTELYPSDYRAYNNLAVLDYEAGDIEGAQANLSKALSKDSSAAEVNTNLGLTSLCNNEVSDAETYLSKSTGALTADEALGNLYIKQGQYDRAVQSFGDTKTNSAALAQILAKDYSKAKSTLEAVEDPDVYTDYLTAIVGARTNNADLVKSSMSKVKAADEALPKLAKDATVPTYSKDATMSTYALSDLEFAKYENEIK